MKSLTLNLETRAHNIIPSSTFSDKMSKAVLLVMVVVGLLACHATCMAVGDNLDNERIEMQGRFVAGLHKFQNGLTGIVVVPTSSASANLCCQIGLQFCCE